MSDRRTERRHHNPSHGNTFRSFIAIEIGEQARHELSRLSAELKSECRGSFVPSEMYHMTLAFLGDINLQEAEAICRVLEDVASSYDPFELKLCRLGFFAQQESATVFCSTEKDNTLISLAHDVYRSAWDVGIPFDDKPFRAHITLGRRVDLRTTRLDSIPVNRIPFTVSSLVLFKSTLRPSGPIYEAVSRIPFRGCPEAK